MKETVQEAVCYFHEKRGYSALFQLFREKYESIGRVGGSVPLINFSNEEVEEIALLMGESPHHLKRKGKLMLADFEQRLQKTRFAPLGLHELLEAYFGERIQSKKEKREELTSIQVGKLADLKQRYPALAPWITYIEAKTSDTHWIWRLLLEPHFTEEVHLLNKAYTDLPQQLERYPLFSQRVSGDPHAFDLTTTRGKLWIHLLHVLAGGIGPPPAQVEEVNELLLSYHLLRDDIHNFVTVANLLAFSSGRLHPVWKVAADTQTILNIPLRELMKIDRVVTTSTSQKVFIVENSGVFSALVDQVPHAPLICTHGQFKLTGLQLMDMLVASGHTLYYSGDFDPEGLAMALRIIERYDDRGRLWRMTVEDYKASIPVVELEDREAKLKPLLTSELGELAETMLIEGKIGYQEGIMSRLIEDLLKI